MEDLCGVRRVGEEESIPPALPIRPHYTTEESIPPALPNRPHHAAAARASSVASSEESELEMILALSGQRATKKALRKCQFDTQQSAKTVREVQGNAAK